MSMISSSLVLLLSTVLLGLLSYSSTRSATVSTKALTTKAPFSSQVPTTKAAEPVTPVPSLEDCENTPIGVADKNIIPDSSFTATSQLDDQHAAKGARLHSKSGWEPKDLNNPKDYLQIDLGKVFVICAITTQGQEKGEGKGTVEYHISTSLDNKLWTFYPNNYSPKLFSGIYDWQSIRPMVKNALEIPVLAKFIRFMPVSFLNRKNLRVEVYGQEYKKKVVPGTCPVFPTRKKCPDNVQHRCYDDAFCGRFIPGTKCCLDDCERRCIVPVATQTPTRKAVIVPGTCPVLPPKLECTTATLNECADDTDCVRLNKAGTKCCLEQGCNEFLCLMANVSTKALTTKAPISSQVPTTKACKDAPIGVADKNIIPDSSFTASSQFDNRYAAKGARLHANSGWEAKDNNNPNDYLQIDLGKVFVICALATQGHYASLAQEWTTQYKISTSVDKKTWTYYPSNYWPNLFRGNKDKHTVVKNVLATPVLAKFIRFIPTEWYGWKSLRVEVYGQKGKVLTVCKYTAVGVANKNIIPDSSFTATSQFNNRYAAKGARLHAKSGWGSYSINNPNDYLQIDLGKMFVVCALATQGQDATYHQEWTTEYKISTSVDSKRWTYYPSNSSPKLFRGNKDKHTVAKNALEIPVLAKFIRFIPTKWHGWKALRVEVYGQEGKVVPGSCPAFPTATQCHLKQVQHECANDVNCSRIKTGTKCCLDGCKRRCVASDVPVTATEVLVPVSEVPVPVCQDDPAIGVANKNVIPDSSFTATSQFDDQHAAKDARLYAKSGWQPKDKNSPNDYLQIDLGKVFVICGLATQGQNARRPKLQRWTTQYKISTSIDNKTWTFYPTNYWPKLFRGNKDTNSVHKNVLKTPVLAKFIRFIPTKWHGSKALRVEVYGMAGKVVPGTCPAFPTATQCPQKIQHQCADDFDCARLQPVTKCCLNGCERRCVFPLETTPVVKKNCAEVLLSGGTKSGVYSVDPDGLGAFKVYCDQTTNGGGWTVLQRRQDGSIDFYRGWNDYKKGFGNLTGEFWFGLEKIYRLTDQPGNRLRVDLQNTTGRTVYGEYSDFAVSSERDNYKISFGKYSGTAGDALSYHRGMAFSTKDRDNDKADGNCAAGHMGGWWYNECQRANLNGLYDHGKLKSYVVGLNWNGGGKRQHYTAKKTEMKIKHP